MTEKGCGTGPSGQPRRTDNTAEGTGAWQPGRVFRQAMRAFDWAYDHDLGWLFGRRLLRLTHVGRRSGRRYQTALEVIGRTGSEVFVLAGWGRSSDWYRNIQANPPIEIVTGRRRFRPAVRFLDETEAVAVVAGYERRNRLITPVVRKMLTKLVGWRYDGSHAARQRLVRERPVVAFRPI